MNPWDRFAARMYGTGDVITNSAGDTLIHDEIVIHPGDIRGAVITAVMCHANERWVCRFGPLFNRLHNLPRVEHTIRRGAMKSRYHK
jgi:hypothetical protein